MDLGVCMVTGANRGIGKAIALGLAQTDMTIVMVCRDQGRAEAARAEIAVESGNPKIEVMIADLASQAAIRELVAEFLATYSNLDVLIRNAGVAKRNRTLTGDGIETTLAVNHLAPFLLTNLLLEVLQSSAPSRVILTSSLVHKWGSIDFDDLQGELRYDIDKAYNQSKLANVLFASELARRLQSTGVSVYSYEPGMTLTEFGSEYTGFKGFMSRVWRPFMVSPAQAAETAIYLATAPEVANMSGSHFVHGKPAQSSPLSLDQELAARLWQVSESLVKSVALDESVPSG